ncbi:hypothetical protein V5P93_000434 [Actinokineospora auranticolor]|uniref:Uncharacterized protein n=1 Tax=Actinokineospora auranticolor TaxID=155976 RepID=A0A2S6GEE0_9PSEU|nr:hypothetical protein [Actinokineospora auranticolor]PPK63511.1 hypothetical protein CLV40_12738 [Actinokineospora auranticolor]
MFDDRPPDGPVHYRHTNAGERIGVIPATCKAGAHSLARVGYIAQASEAEGVVRISCRACNEDVDVDHFWVLALSGAPPYSVELDDEPYRAMVPLMVDARGRGLPPERWPRAT